MSKKPLLAAAAALALLLTPHVAAAQQQSPPDAPWPSQAGATSPSETAPTPDAGEAYGAEAARPVAADPYNAATPPQAPSTARVDSNGEGAPYSGTACSVAAQGVTYAGASSASAQDGYGAGDRYGENGYRDDRFVFSPTSSCPAATASTAISMRRTWTTSGTSSTTSTRPTRKARICKAAGKFPGAWASTTSSCRACASSWRGCSPTTISMTSTHWRSRRCGLGNALYEFKLGLVNPYLGAGVGFGRTRLNYDPDDDLDVADDTTRILSDSGLIWQLKAGLAFPIQENMIVDAGYRYFNGARVENTFTNAAGAVIEGELDPEIHAITVGFRFKPRY